MLRFFCVALEFIGWLLISGGVGWIAGVVSGPSFSLEVEKDFGKFVSIISWFSFDFAFLGLMAVIFAHLGRYIFDKNFHKIWLLRFSDKILYVFAIFTVWWQFSSGSTI